MRKFLLFLLSQLLFATSRAQQNYWQQEVHYTIDVSLDDTANSLTGFEKIEYINHSPDTLKFIWFHLWPNAYKNDKTAFTDQALENGGARFYFSGKDEKGYINRLDFKVDNITAQLEDHPQHIDITRLVLPSPLPPGKKILITTPFHVQLPYNFSRGGHDGQSYQATQWYPKPAVYDKYGWHPMPYLDQGEFYSEFGSFDVWITLPRNYVVAATGELENPGEKAWLQSRSSFTWEAAKQKEKIISGQPGISRPLFPESEKQTKTLRFTQDNIHDFAWFADKRFIVNRDTCLLRSGKVIEVSAFYTPQYKETWSNSVNYAKKAVRHYSELVGEYPYPVVKVVQGPESFGGGMEYPTITVIAPKGNVKDLDQTIAHEIGHNWFYGVLATNERDYPWMDEGINTYYDARYSEERYGKQPQFERIAFETKAFQKTDQPIATSSEKFSAANYDLVAYYKTAEWLRYLESQLGPEVFNKAMQDYYRRWQFKHPQPEDFKKSLEESSGRNLDDLFSYLNKTGTLPNQKRTGTKTVFLFDLKSLTRYTKAPSRELVLLGPAIGVNSYDKLMLGVLATNLKLPPSPFQFLLAPMYATGSKDFTGLGLIRYNLYTKGWIRKLELGVSGSAFTMDELRTGDEKKIYFGFHKIVPGIKLTAKEKNPRSTFNRFAQFKLFLIGEDVFRSYRDTVIRGTDTTIATRYTTKEKDRTISQLQFVIENNRALYPYRGELKVEAGKDFIRTGFTGKYFFNYVKEGGLDLRVFAGKFFYTAAKTYAKQLTTDRYQLNMTGASGYEDYTYSNYFIGRNRFKALPSQQIMVRDGAFKVRTDLLADKVGKTDDWLAALNLSSNIPAEINPLALLPVRIPLQIFLDIGTYAEAWKQNAETDRFLFDAGIRLPLLRGAVNIYIPLVYSGIYRDYIQSTLEKKDRFWKKLSFSIDISDFNSRKIDGWLNF